MTRINCVPVECLTNKHLLAEYKEITRPFNKVLARIEKGTMEDVVIPESYRLGSGHETFFFDKLSWLFRRYYELYYELAFVRGFKLDHDKFDEVHFKLKENCTDSKHKPYWNDWTPTPEDMYLNMARLAKRSNLGSVLKELSSNN